MTKPWLRDFETLYRETGNPLYAWEALYNCDPDEPLPRWLFEYLAGCARAWGAEHPAWDPPTDAGTPRRRGLLDMADVVVRHPRKAAQAAALTARALGLRRGRNYNAFEAYRRDRICAAEAWHVDVKRAGEKQEAARAEIEQYLVKASGGRRKNAESFRSQVKARIRRARALLKAQERARGD